MKQQISKVALIATLAFIGVGFAGTQRVNAVPLTCPPTLPVDRLTCGNTYTTEREYEPNEDEAGDLLVCERSWRTAVDDAGCWDTNGNCVPDTRYKVTVEESHCTDLQTNEDLECDYVFYEVLEPCTAA